MKHILITGATGGLGQALALAYAAPGILLSLTGRREDTLQALARQCEQKGAQVRLYALDLREIQEINQYFRNIDSHHPVDIVIANAGVSSSIGSQGQNEALQDARRVCTVNFLAVLECLHPLAENMRQRGKGQIGVVASLGGWQGLPYSPAYSASKAAVRVYAQALRAWLRPYGVWVSVISPGFVRSAMSSRYQGNKPFMLSAPQAAERIKKGLERGKAEICFPWPLAWGMRLLDLLPAPVADSILRRFFRFHVLPDRDSPLSDRKGNE